MSAAIAMSRKICMLAGIVALQMSPSHCDATPYFYSSNEITARVVDARTKENVAGAIAVVIWQLERPRWFHGTENDVLYRAVATTSAAGVFVVPSWGPRFGGLTWNVSAISPKVYVLKSGYAFLSVSNYAAPGVGFRTAESEVADVANWVHVRSPIVVSWNRATLYLQRSERTPNDDASSLGYILRQVCSESRLAECEPGILQFFRDEKARLTREGATQATWHVP